jgi:hypothetical protein
MKEEIEGTKGVIRIRKSKKDRQPNDQENKCTTRQKYTQKTDDREIQTPLNINDA